MSNPKIKLQIPQIKIGAYHANKKEFIRTQDWHSKEVANRPHFSKKQMMQLVTNQLKKVHENKNNEKYDIKTQIVLGFDDGENSIIYKRGKFRKIDVKQEYFNEHDDYTEFKVPDPGHYKQFRINYYFTPKDGGCKEKFHDDKNDCLFLVLQQAGVTEFKNDRELKIYLGVRPTDPIPHNCMEKLENKLRSYSINLRGSAQYISTKEKNQSIDILIQDGHYRLDRNLCGKLKKTNYAKPKTLCLYEKHNGIAKCYYRNKKEGEINFEISSKELHKAVNTITIDKDNCLTKFAFYVFKPSKKMISNGIDTMDKYYESFVNENQQIMTLSKNKIDLRKNITLAACAKDFYDRFQKTVHFENIDQHEYIIMENSVIGPIVKAYDYTGEAWKYDWNGFYSYIQQSEKFNIPITKPTYHKLDELPTILKTGMYHVEIEVKPDIFFRYNIRDEWYTHLDINSAIQVFGLKVTLINDNKANACIYSKLVKGHTLFRQPIKELYEMSIEAEHKNQMLKTIRTSIWGALTQANIQTLYEKEGVEFLIHDDKEFLGSYPAKNGMEKYEVAKVNNYYRHNEARLKPFLLAKSKEHVYRFIEKYVGFDNIVRFHTDGFIVKKKLDHELLVKEGHLGKELGMLKYEGYCEKCTIDTEKYMKVDGMFA